MAEGTDDGREELCSRFRATLSDNGSDRYFDEDELIEIFDYAGDLNDDYIRFEVLLCGARLYPDSIPLRERRALLYSAFGEDLSEKYLEDNNSQQSALWDIARLRNSNPAGAEAVRQLELLLSHYDEFDDEEVIQLVDLASSLGQTDWLTDRLDALRAHVTYLPTLLFEIAVVLEMNGRYDEAIKLLEELTNIEPYNEQYWFMLAQEYDLAGNVDGSLSALDLALAILPDDKAMRFYQARILARDEHTTDRAVDILVKLADEFPEDIDICHFLATMYVDMAQSDDMAEKMRNFRLAASALDKCFKLNPGDVKLATDILAIGLSPADEVISIVDKKNPPATTAEWIEWAKSLEDLDVYDKAVKVLLYYEKKIGRQDPDVNDALVRNFFMLKDFKSVTRYYERHCEGKSGSTSDDAGLQVVIYVLSVIRNGQYQTAMELIDGIKTFFSDQPSAGIGDTLRRIGVVAVLNEMRRRLMLPPAQADWDRFDPLGAWG